MTALYIYIYIYVCISCSKCCYCSNYKQQIVKLHCNYSSIPVTLNAILIKSILHLYHGLMNSREILDKWKYLITLMTFTLFKSFKHFSILLALQVDHKLYPFALLTFICPPPATHASSLKLILCVCSFVYCYTLFMPQFSCWCIKLYYTATTPNKWALYLNILYKIFGHLNQGWVNVCNIAMWSLWRSW